MWVSAVYTDICGVQKRVSDPLDSCEMPAVETQFGSPVRAAGTRDH